VLTRPHTAARMDDARQIMLGWRDFFRRILDGRTSPSSSYKKARSGERRPHRALQNRLLEALRAGCSPALIKREGTLAFCLMVDRCQAIVVEDQRALTAQARWSIA
jgi:hypothetical protein